MSEARIGKNDLLKYAALAVPISFAGFPLYVLAPDFYATHHNVSLSLLGFILLALRLFDAVQDPVIGVLSDRYHIYTPWFMVISAVALCIGIYGLFNAAPVDPALWFSLCILITVTAYSILSINLNTLGGLWTSNKNDQTRISGWREAFGLCGLVIAVSLPAALKKLTGEEQAYFYYSLILCLIMLFAWILFRPWLADAVKKDISIKKPSLSLFAGMKAITSQVRLFLAVYGVSMLASSIPAVLVIFFVRDLLGAENMTGLFLLIYFMSGALSMPVWKYLSSKMGKYSAWSMGIVLAVASFVWAFFLDYGDIWQYALICLLTGVALGADLVLPPSILADHIHANKAQQHAATHYALIAFVSKLALAAASAIALPLIAASGFVPGAENSQPALLALSVAYAVIPCVLKLTSAVLIAYLFIFSHQGCAHENSKNSHSNRSSHYA